MKNTTSKNIAPLAAVENAAQMVNSGPLMAGCNTSAAPLLAGCVVQLDRQAPLLAGCIVRAVESPLLAGCIVDNVGAAALNSK